MNTEQCPFCPILLPLDPSLWNTIGSDFFGGDATIGGIRSCGDCAQTAQYSASEQALVDEMARIQTQKQSA